MVRYPLALIVSFLVISFYSYSAGIRIAKDLSPQGCRMSWMSPSYIQQVHFDKSWTPLAERYSLWLYREVDYEPNQVQGGVPVLFIPGNAGSSRQVRSIASSAARQFFSSPFIANTELSSRSVKQLDFYAVEFNEDLSAFHGSTLESEISYTSSAINYVLSLYPSNTSVIIMGHSMGGVVATALLPSPNISAIFTMSTPHTLPPARFDSRIDRLYSKNMESLRSDQTPIVSLCGGAADAMVGSESCVLPSRNHTDAPFRRTVFTSALEGAWTGVGHREMVWCHQVRWRVARAALEIGTSLWNGGKAEILDEWLRDGSAVPPKALRAVLGEDFFLRDNLAYEIVSGDAPLVLAGPQGSMVYLIPVPETGSSPETRFMLFVSQGRILSVGPQHSSPLRVSVHACRLRDDIPVCKELTPDTLKLVPNPLPTSVFPVPDKGADESEGAVFYEAVVPRGTIWINVQVEDGDGSGWVFGGFGHSEVENDVTTGGLLFGDVTVHLPREGALRTTVKLPNLLSHALMVYRITPIMEAREPSCADPLLSPLLMHVSHSTETHYYPLITSPGRRILLHTHLPAPYVASPADLPAGVSFDILVASPQHCGSGLSGVAITVDWSASIGRLATRYPTTLLTWALGVVSVIIFSAWKMNETTGAPLAALSSSLAHYSRRTLPRLMLLSFLVALLPLPEKYYLGTRGEPLYAILAPLLMLAASGLVCMLWWVLLLLMWPLGKLGGSGYGRQRGGSSVLRSTVFSMAFIFLLIFLFIPWQVAFLGCWMIHLYTCASSRPQPHPGSTSAAAISTAIPLIRRDFESNEDGSNTSRSVDNNEVQQRVQACQFQRTDNQHHNAYLLLFMTLLLPLAAPVLAVWVRTLVTAGLTTPFDGDHFFLNVAPFLILVDFASWTMGPLLPRQSFEDRLPIRWAFICLAVAAFFLGPRQAYSVFDAARVVIGVIVVVRIGPRYWGGIPWFTTVDQRAR